MKNDVLSLTELNNDGRVYKANLSDNCPKCSRHVFLEEMEKKVRQFRPFDTTKTAVFISTHT